LDTEKTFEDFYRWSTQTTKIEFHELCKANSLIDIPKKEIGFAIINIVVHTVSQDLLTPSTQTTYIQTGKKMFLQQGRQGVSGNIQRFQAFSSLEKNIDNIISLVKTLAEWRARVSPEVVFHVGRNFI